MNNLWTLLAAVTAALVFVTGCAPKAEKKPTAQNKEEIVGANETVACEGKDSGTRPDFTSNAALNGNEVYLKDKFENGTDQSLCLVLEESGKDIIWMQFAGILCTSCKGEAEQISELLASTDVGAKIKHIVVFTDSPDSGLSESFVNDFIIGNTQKRAVAKYEPGKFMMQKFNTDPTGQKFGASVLFNKFGQAYFISDATDIPELLKKAEEMIP